MRVYELAKELGLSSKNLIELMEKQGIKVKNHMSGVDSDTVKLLKKLAKETVKKATAAEKKKTKKVQAPKAGKAEPRTKKVAEKKTATKTKTVTKPKAKTKTVTKPKAEPKAKPKTELKAKPKTEPKATAKAPPKTKPKACNYGLNFAKGEYLVIYDAEDVPDPLQLKKVYVAFGKVAKNVRCIQAKLNYHNSHQNLLTRFFTAEYSLWFDVILTGLQTANTVIPLGGTSNHFQTEDLRKLKAWDPFKERTYAKVN